MLSHHTCVNATQWDLQTPAPTASCVQSGQVGFGYNCTTDSPCCSASAYCLPVNLNVTQNTTYYNNTQIYCYELPPYPETTFVPDINPYNYGECYSENTYC